MIKEKQPTEGGDKQTVEATAKPTSIFAPVKSAPARLNQRSTPSDASKAADTFGFQRKCGEKGPQSRPDDGVEANVLPPRLEEE